MVSTKEIIYVLLITLAATGGYYGDENYSGLPYGALLPLLLLLLLSTDRPFNNAFPQATCCSILQSPCPGRRGGNFGGPLGGPLGGFGGGLF